MAARLKKQAAVMKMLSLSKPAATKAILKTASPDLVHVLTECCLNVLKGNVSLTPRQRKNLARYKRIMRQLSRKSMPLKKKKQLLQTGGFLQYLLKPIVGLLSNL